MTIPDAIERTRKGIAAYSHEREVLLRLLKKRGSFSETDFDSWLRLREWRRPVRCRRVTKDTFVLGIGVNGWNEWAIWLDLLRCMIQLGEVDTKKENGLIIYRPGSRIRLNR